MTPADENILIEVLRHEQMRLKEPVPPENLIGKTKYHDPGRELRRLFEKGRIYRTKDGKYSTNLGYKTNSLERWNWHT